MIRRLTLRQQLWLLLALTCLVVMLLLDACGVQVANGRAKLPLADGRCALVVGDYLGEAPGGQPATCGPLDRDSSQFGIVCDLWRFE